MLDAYNGCGDMIGRKEGEIRSGHGGDSKYGYDEGGDWHGGDRSMRS